MEAQLRLVLGCALKETRVRYVKECDTISTSNKELQIDLSRLEACPDEHQIMRAIEKRIGRSDVLRSKKEALGICVLILLSRGYCVSTLTLADVTNPFIERCWECVHVVSQNIPEEASVWIKDCMGTRNPSGFASLFCVPSSPHYVTNMLGEYIIPRGAFVPEFVSKLGGSTTVWHRNDVVMETIIMHCRLQQRHLLGDL